MTLSVADCGRVLGVAALTGMRSMSGLALVSYTASRGYLRKLEGTSPSRLNSRSLSHALIITALGEINGSRQAPFLAWP